MPDRSWTLLGSEVISNERIFRVRHDRYRFEPSGVEQDFVVLDAPDWVNVVPLTADGQVVLVRQFRHGIRRASLEIPGGVVDARETPEAAVLRELREETGYVPQRVRLLGRVHPNPAIQANYCYMYLAEGCRRVAPPHLDPLEQMEVVLRPLAEVPELIRREEITHGLILNAFGFLGLAHRAQELSG